MKPSKCPKCDGFLKLDTDAGGYEAIVCMNCGDRTVLSYTNEVTVEINESKPRRNTNSNWSNESRVQKKIAGNKNALEILTNIKLPHEKFYTYSQMGRHLGMSPACISVWVKRLSLEVKLRSEKGKTRQVGITCIKDLIQGFRQLTKNLELEIEKGRGG